MTRMFVLIFVLAFAAENVQDVNPDSLQKAKTPITRQNNNQVYPQQPYNPQTGGQYNPSGQYNPQTGGQYNPQTGGQYNPNGAAQYPHAGYPQTGTNTHGYPQTGTNHGYPNHNSHYPYGMYTTKKPALSQFNSLSMFLLVALPICMTCAFCIGKRMPNTTNSDPYLEERMYDPIAFEERASRRGASRPRMDNSDYVMTIDPKGDPPLATRGRQGPRGRSKSRH